MDEDQQSRLNLLAKGAGLTAIGMIFSKAVTYFYRVLVAQIGPGAYGQLSQAIAITALGATFTLLALNQAVEKYVTEFLSSNEPHKIRGVIICSLTLIIPLGILTAIALNLFARPIAELLGSPGIAPILAILAFAPVFNGIGAVFSAALKAFKDVEQQVFAERVVQSASQLLITYILIEIGLGIESAAIGWVIAAATVPLVTAIFLWRKDIEIFSTDYEKMYHQLMSFSGPLVFTGVISVILGHADTLMLGYFLSSDTPVGLYNAAFPTALLLLVPYQAVSSLVLPSMTEVKNDRDKLSNTLTTVTRWTFYLTFPMFIVMAIFSQDILGILFGSEYSKAGTALTILAIGQLYNTSLGHLGGVIRSISETNILLKNSVGQLILNLILNIILIPKYGLIGAATATSVSIIFLNTLLLVEVYHFKNVHPFSKDSLKSVAAGLISITLIYASLKSIFTTIPIWALIPALAIFSTFYGLILIGLGGIKEEDAEIIIRTGKKFNMQKTSEKIADLIQK